MLFKYAIASVLPIFKKDVLKPSTVIVCFFISLAEFQFLICVVGYILSGLLYFPNESLFYHLDNDLFFFLALVLFELKPVFSNINIANPFVFFHNLSVSLWFRHESKNIKY